MARTAAAQKPVEKPATVVGVEWHPSPGTKHWMVFNDGEVLCLAAGQVTDRMKLQAQSVAKAIDE